jgi:hypothetical protein
METTVVKHAIIVNAKLVTQYLVNVNTVVKLVGKVTNVNKVSHIVCITLMLYVLHKG